MNSPELQRHIDAITAEIAVKTARLQAIPGEKSRVLHDEKKLGLLEKEADEIPVLLTRLRERSTLLGLELEAALTSEAGERLNSLNSEWGAIAQRVSEQTGGVRVALEKVADLLTAAHAAWEGYELRATESRYLSLRFGLPRVPHPLTDKMQRTELERFSQRLIELLQRPCDSNYWIDLIDELLAERRRAAAQQPALHQQPSITVTDRNPRAFYEAQQQQIARDRVAPPGPAAPPNIMHRLRDVPTSGKSNNQ